MIIWIFREERSGSTAFADKVARHLSREHKFVNMNDFTMVQAIANPQDYVFSTHSFDFLEIMEYYSDDVLLIRCTRKNKVEHWMSYMLAWRMNKAVNHTKRFWNIKRDNSLNTELDTFIKAQPVLITKKEVASCYEYFCSMKELWDRISINYQHVNVYYEDLCNPGVNIPLINLSDCKITDQDSYTIKLPDYKQRLCMNYDMVRKWIENYSAQVVEW